MKLVMTILARDEEDVLDEMIRYHLERGVDYVIATDNRSVDGTREILERYAKEGCLHLIHEPGEDYRQAAWVTRMARLAATSFSADWVINSDADEFWWPRAGNLKDVITELPLAVMSISAPVSHFVPHRNESGAFFDRMVVRQAGALEDADALPLPPEPPKVAHRALANVEVQPGNHGLAGFRRPLPWWPILVLHFPVRTYAQFENKVRLFGAAVEHNPDWARRSPEKVRLYRRYREGALAEWYAARIPTEASIERSIDEGIMVVDRRLQRFLHANARKLGDESASQVADLPAEDADALERAQLRLEFERAQDLARRREAEASREGRQLARAERRAGRLERRLEKLRGRQQRRGAPPDERRNAPGTARRLARVLGRLTPGGQR